MAGFCDRSVAVQARSGVGRGAAQLAVDGGAGDVEQLGQLGLGVLTGGVQRQQVLALRGRELGLLAFELPLDQAMAMPSRVRRRMRSASNSATMPSTLNSNRPTASLGS